MNFSQWLAANGYDETKLNEAQKKHLEAAYRAEQERKDTNKDELAEMQANAERVDQIRRLTAQAAVLHPHNAEKLAQLQALRDMAIADPKMSTKEFQIQLLYTDRRLGAMVTRPEGPQATDSVVEAAVCLTHKLPNVEKCFNEQTLEAATKQFRRGLGIKRLLTMGARSRGYRGDDDNYFAVCRHLFRASLDEGSDFRADVGPSTGIQVPGILSNIANKFLAASFMNVDQSWRGIARVRPVNDFKQITTYRMSGNNTFLRVAPGGEIKHGALSETSYTNQAKTYGRLLGISREDYINDDLGAFINTTNELGRGGAEGLNNIFWASWLDDSTFFPTDKSKLNYDDGATDSVLSLAGLDNAETIFVTQTKPDGSPLGATPVILLVPAALKNTALTLMMSQNTNVATSTVALTGNQNIFAGRYRVIASPYLQRTTLPDENGVSQTVTGSSTAWYLLADPADIAAIEVVFLFGKDVPTVETDQFEFDRLGLATRAYFDFGVSKQEYRGGVKLKGAA